MKIKFIIIFIIVMSFAFIIFKYEHDTKVNEYLEEKTTHYEIMYKAIYSQFKQDSKIIYDHIMIKHPVVEIYKKLQTTLSIEEENNLRNKLFIILENDYIYFKELKLKQLHFHLPDNTSFLRMHEPSKYSDNLTKFRDTVVYVNKNNIQIDGYETGKIYSGFRFVYPIKDENNVHLGSIEASFDVAGFTSKFMQYYKVLCNFHIDKNIVDKKIFDEFKDKHYVNSPFTGYYLEKNTLNEIKKVKKEFKLNKEKMKSFQAKQRGLKSIIDNKSISSFDEVINKVITFIPMTNPVTGEVTSFFTIRTDATYINNKKQNFYFIFVLISIFTIIILYLIYKIITSKDNLNTLLKETVDSKTKELNNLNKNLEQTVQNRTKELELSKVKMKDYINLIDKNIITSSTDLKGEITEVSYAFCAITGYSKNELIGQSHSIIRHPDMNNNIFEKLWDSCNNDKPWKGELKNLKKDGGFYWVNASIYPIYDENNKKIGYTAIRQDITNQKIIEEISITDGLTNIYNRRHFNEQFPKFINSLKRTNELVCFLIMDIDYFKQYNDTYGHQMGDTALKEVALSIKNTLLRLEDSCYRLGGEEFGVIFKSENKKQALLFANIIKQNIEDLKIEHEKNSASDYITVSMGLVCKNANDIKDDDTIFKEADDFLYSAKKSGRNKISSN